MIIQNDGPDRVIGHELMRHGEQRSVPDRVGAALLEQYPGLRDVDAVPGIVTPFDGAPYDHAALPVATGIPVDGAVDLPMEIDEAVLDSLRDENGQIVPVPAGDLAADLATPKPRTKRG